MALSLRRGTSWSQVCLGQSNLASKLYLTTLSPVVYHCINLGSHSNLHRLHTVNPRPATVFLGTNKKVNLTGLSVHSSSSSNSRRRRNNSSNNNNNNNSGIIIGGNNESIQASGIISRSKGQCESGLFSGLHRSLFNTALPFTNPIRLFRTWEPSVKVLYAKKSGEREMSNLKVDVATTDSKKSPSSGSDSPDSMGSSVSAKFSPQGGREDVAPKNMWTIKKDEHLKESIEERKTRCKSGKYTLLENIETWPVYYSRKEHEIKDDRKGIKGSLKSPCPQLNQKVSLWKGDITSLVIDAIVNAANESLMGGGGVDGAIHSASGKFLKQECMTLKPCPTGHAVITGGYELPAKYVIHTVGPRGEDSDKLRSCYENSLNCLLKTELKSVAFPCVSTGIYGYPNDKAAEVVLKTVREWLEINHEKVERVIFCLFLEKDIRIYEEKMQQYFPLPSSETGNGKEKEKNGGTCESKTKAGQDEA